MSESGQRSRIIRALKPLHAIPVENRVGIGTPDVNYADGWIELKWLRRWPKNPDTVVALDHFTIQQRRWLNRRFNLSYNAWLILQVQREWMLFTGRDAADYVGNMSRSGLYRCARVRWTAGLKNKELVECLLLDWDEANWDALPLVSGSFSIVDGKIVRS